MPCQQGRRCDSILGATARSRSAHRNGAHPPEVCQKASQLECNGLVHLPQRQMLYFSADGARFQLESCAHNSLST